MDSYWTQRSLYDRLEVENSATTEEIKSAYRLMSTVWHPDKQAGHFADRCTARFQGIREAYETLVDPIARQRYDAGNVGGAHRLSSATPGPFDDPIWNNPQVWFGMARWMKDEDCGDGFHRRMAFSAGDLMERGREPSAKQMPYMEAARRMALDDGFDPVDAAKS
jgi:DnaJ-class molecular chaperone